MTQSLDDNLSEEQGIETDDPILSKIIEVYIKEGLDRWLHPTEIAVKANLDIRDIRKTLQDNLPIDNRRIKKPGIFDIRGQDTNQAFRLKALKSKRYLMQKSVEKYTQESLGTLTNNPEFIRAADIFTKAIANANGLPYDDASGLGLRTAYFYYMAQEHDARAWNLERTEETNLEKRLKDVCAFWRNNKSMEKGYVYRPSLVLEAILRLMEKKKKVDKLSETEIPDILILPAERMEIEDWLTSAGLANYLEHELSLFDGREWRQHVLIINTKKVAAYTNPENALRDTLAKPEYVRIIGDLLAGKNLDSNDLNNAYRIKKLKNLGFIDISKKTEYVYTKQETITLLPKILKYCPFAAFKVLENADPNTSLSHTLEKLNFDVTNLTDEFTSIEDLKKIVQNPPAVEIAPNAQLPIFFKPNPELINYKAFTKLAAKIYGASIDSLEDKIPEITKKELVDLVGRTCGPEITQSLKHETIDILKAFYTRQPHRIKMASSIVAGALYLAHVALGKKQTKYEIAQKINISPTQIYRNAQILNTVLQIEKDPLPSELIEQICDKRRFSSEIRNEAIKLLDEYYKINATTPTVKMVRAGVYIAANKLGKTISQHEVVKYTGSKSKNAPFSEYVKKLADFHKIDVHKLINGEPEPAPVVKEVKIEKPTQQISPKAEEPKPRAWLERSSPKIGFNDMAAAASLLDITTNDSLRQFGDMIYINASVPLTDLDRTTAQFVHFVTKKGGVERAAESGNAKLVISYVNSTQKTIIEQKLTKPTESLNKVSTVKKERGDIDMTKKDTQFNYADIASAAKEADIKIKERGELKNYVTGIYQNAGFDKTVAASRAGNFVSFIKVHGGAKYFANLAKDGNLDNIMKYLPKGKETIDEKLNEKEPEEPKETKVKPGQTPFNYADMAAALYSIKADMKDYKENALTIVKQICEKAGVKNPQSFVYNFTYQVKKHGGPGIGATRALQNLAVKGYLAKVQPYMTAQTLTLTASIGGGEPVPQQTSPHKTKTDKHGILDTFNMLGNKLEDLVTAGVMTPQEAIALADDVRSKTHEYGKTYIAKEKERFAKVEQIVNDILYNQKNKTPCSA